MSLAALLDEIRADLQDIPEVRRVYEDVPDSVNETPAIIVASLGADCHLASHGKADGTTPLHCQHQIRVEVHVPRKNLSKATSDLNAIAPAVALRLYSGFVRDKFNGTMLFTGDARRSNALGVLNYQIGPSEWAGMQTYAMVCDFRVTTEEEVLP